MIYQKQCPTCKKDIFYSCKKSVKFSIERNSDCKQCSAFKKPPKSEEVKQKISGTLTGRVMPIIVRNKIGESMIEKWNDLNYREKLLPTRRGKNNGMYGKHHDEETRKKISELTRAKMKSPEVKEKTKQVHSSIEY